MAGSNFGYYNGLSEQGVNSLLQRLGHRTLCLCGVYSHWLILPLYLGFSDNLYDLRKKNFVFLTHWRVGMGGRWPASFIYFHKGRRYMTRKCNSYMVSSQPTALQ